MQLQDMSSVYRNSKQMSSVKKSAHFSWTFLGLKEQ